MTQIRVLHIISGLGSGGAEWMLYRLLRASDDGRNLQHVVSLTDTEPMGCRIRDLGVRVDALRLSPEHPNPLGLFRLASHIRRFRPDVIQTWMYHADLAGGVAAKFAGRVPVVWGIHHTTFSSSDAKPRTLRVVKLCALLSKRLPNRIVCCSEATMRSHIDLGYDRSRMQVIPNGFDLELFKPDTSARHSVRRELGLPDNVLLIGMVARYHPQKDHRNFIVAASLIADVLPTSHFVLCGSGVEPDNKPLMDLIASSGIGNRTHLLGARNDTPRLYAALDIYVSPASHGEAFPLVVGEAMACGVPCVVTDVGDSSIIVDDTGVVVPPRNPSALAGGWRQLLTMDAKERRKLGERARRRIQDNYEIHEVERRFSEVYGELSHAA